MEWNNHRYQSSICFRPRHLHDEDDDKESFQDVWQLPQSNLVGIEEGARRNVLPETEFSRTLGSETAVSQSLSSLRLPQLEEAPHDFQPPFYSSQTLSFSDTAMVPQFQSSLFSSPSQDQEQQPLLQQQGSGQVPLQFGSLLSEFPEEQDNYMRSILPASMPMQKAAMRPSMDFFSDGIPTLHCVHSSVPTVPASFGSLAQQQQQQQEIFLPVFEDQKTEFDDTIAQGMPSTMFHHSTMSSKSMPSTQTSNSQQMMEFSSMNNFPSNQNSRFESKTFEYSPVVEPPRRAKRGTGLSEPFSEMIVTDVPKFSPDKRKLCSVEGCVSQARAFNRCKRHGGSKRCSSPGCTKSVQSRGLCIRHGGGSRCQEHGCTRASQSQGRCKLHGGGRPCIVVGCEKKAHLKRLCRKHGGGTKCCVTGCNKWSQRQGMCMTHSKVIGPQRSGITGNELNLFDQKPAPPDMSPPPSLEMFTEEI